jgi:hypothetical protein
MKAYRYADGANFDAVFNAALTEDGAVGATPLDRTLERKKSPFEGIEGVRADVTMDEIIEILRG